MSVEELLEQEFVDGMYKNMWNFMNPNTIKYILTEIGLKINVLMIDKNIDPLENKKYANSICFKGDENSGGHYVYISKERKVWGSYEKQILLKYDDGMCHGVAILFAILKNPNKDKIKNNLEKLGFIPTLRVLTSANLSFKLFIRNYINILTLYKFIIEKGYWDSALKIYFPTEIKQVDNQNLSSQSKKALCLISAKIRELEIELMTK
jgi:hypothetical protein